MRAVCVREVQQSLRESAKRLLEDTIRTMGVGTKFGILSDRIETPGGGVIIFQGMADHTAESIKSLEGFRRAWVEEAQTLSARSLTMLRPTIRMEGSEIWFSWNPRSKSDPVDKMFRSGDPPTGSVSVSANWSDNPWFPSTLEAERLDCQRTNPDQYDHIWEGGYVSVAEGAYYATQLTRARREGRIGKVARDPLMGIRLYWDIGGAGSKADACSIWVTQFIGREVRLIDYYEAQGQPLDAHVAWLANRGYGPGRVLCVLPHDGGTSDRVYAVSFEGALRKVGYEVTVVPNQGKGAAMQRVQALRNLFPQIWIDEANCTSGIDALGWYHERRDEHRNAGLGPEHDWSSHCADALGLMAIHYTPPHAGAAEVKMPQPIRAIGGR